MKSRSLRWLARGFAATSLCATALAALPAHAAPWDNRHLTFANTRFEQVWRQTDANPGGRSLTWGPKPWFDYKEFYKQSPNSLRQVQYFDKSRMEINNPSDTGGALGGVTNGLLPVEMVSGRLKLGDATTTAENEQRNPAQIPVAGDLAKVNPNAPTYASFARVATTDNGYTDRSRINENIGTTYDKDGNIGFRQDLANQPGTKIVQYATATGHNEPEVFVTYKNAGAVAALVAFGYPITDPYWIRARVGGQEKDIMVQIYERRVLTYTPSNNEPYKVEMGNVGQHYFQWRYPELGTPWDAEEPTIPLAFASNRGTGHYETYTTDPNGANQAAITGTGNDTTPYSLRRSWDKTQQFFVATTRREASANLQLYRVSLDGSTQTRLTTDRSDNYDGAVSPDGTKVLFVSTRTGAHPELYLMNINGTGVAQLTTTPAGCVTDHPSWLPDGSGIVYATTCPEGTLLTTSEILRADIKYTQDKLNDLQATLISGRRLTNNTTNDRAPRLSPDGTKIAFVSERDGNAEIYVMKLDGSLQQRLTNSTSDDGAPAWSQDGAKLVFESNRDGDYEIYTMNAADGNNQIQITNNAQADRSPLWAQ